jgi:hypothetical protein
MTLEEGDPSFSPSFFEEEDENAGSSISACADERLGAEKKLGAPRSVVTSCAAVPFLATAGCIKALLSAGGSSSAAAAFTDSFKRRSRTR